MKILKSFAVVAACSLVGATSWCKTSASFKPNVVAITIAGDNDVTALVDKMTDASVPGPNATEFKMPFYTTVSGVKVFDFLCQVTAAEQAKDNCLLIVYGDSPWTSVKDPVATLDLGRSQDSNLAAAEFIADASGLIFESSDHALTIRSEPEVGGFRAFSIHYSKQARR